ncbi:hypothetical protein AB1Y20_022150 [Prymnesium parvum]|uniref:Uncharacterized protein n=1 Tax=Prymnesium parvum TaxID=97485 RepID=A0AB34JFC0_PRYPA
MGLSLDAQLERWGWEDGGLVSCRVTLASAASSPTTEWIDWLALQCCGFVHQSAGGSGGAPKPSPTPPAGSGTALHDETLSHDDSRSCILNSQPQVVTAGLALLPGQKVAYLVTARLATGLPPTFSGHAVRYEYLLILTVRAMAPPSRFSQAWSRSPDYAVRLPVRVIAAAHGTHLPAPLALAAAERAAGLASRVPPLRCEVSCEEVAASSEEDDDGEERGHEGWSDEEEGRESCGGAQGGERREEEGEGSWRGPAPTSSWPSYRVQRDGLLIAQVQLASVECCVGGVLRGTIELEQTARERGRACAVCDRLVLSLRLSELVVNARGGPGTLAGTHTIGRQEVRTRHLRRWTIEIHLPEHMPPQITTAEVSLTWALAFSFELGSLESDGSARNQTPQRLDWELPLTVYATPTPGVAPAFESPQSGSIHIPTR